MVKLLVAAFLALGAWEPGDTFTGRVVGVADGDNITVLVGQEQVKVRLDGIDAPERSQPFTNVAKQRLSDLVHGKEVRVEVKDTDRYGRTVGRVFLDRHDMSLAMVRAGLAWQYTQYNSEQSLADAQLAAQDEMLGIWSMPGPVPPWEFRAAGGQPAGVAAAPAPAPQPLRSSPARTPSSGFRCGSKRFCREMTSCAEARFYLTQCGRSSLDGDRDGIPCETLCRGG